MEEYSHLCCAVFLLFPPPLSLYLFNLPRILRPHCILYIHEPLCSTFWAAQSPGSEVQVWIESRTRLRVFYLASFSWLSLWTKDYYSWQAAPSTHFSSL